MMNDNMVRYISLFSGIEAASVAWQPLGWKPVAFSEIDPFPKAVLSARYPDVPDLGDITKIDWSSRRGGADVVVGGSPCFVAGTLVLTDSGFRPIETIKIGDLVVTHRGKLRKVVRVGSSISDTILLKGQGSVGVECTRNHPFLSIKKVRRWDSNKREYLLYSSSPEWMSAENMEGRFWLNVGEFSPVDIPPFDGFAKGERGKGYIENFEFSDDFFYFVGRWLGDGWANAHKRKARVDSQMKRVYLCSSHTEGDELQCRLESIGIHFYRSHERTVEKFTFSSTQLFDWITSNFGVHAAGKNMPAWCFGMRRDFRRKLLEGYLDADGTLFENGYKSSTISRALALGMKTLAATLGISSSITESKNDRDCVIEGRHVHECANYCQSYYKSTRSSFFSYGGWYGKVRSVCRCRKNQIVYNLEVEDDHSYTADGIAVHNCQSFSVAGSRTGLDGASGLMWEYVRAVQGIRPRWFVWENVPGALSSSHGEDFRCLLKAMDDIGYGMAWRVLDAQFFGVAQRRRRVFLVGHFGDQRACEVLFEPEGMSWNSTSSRKKRQALAGGAAGGAGKAGGTNSLTPWDGQSRRLYSDDEPYPTLDARTGKAGADSRGVIAFSAGQSSKAGGLGLGEDVTPTLRGASSGTNQVPSIYQIAGNVIGRAPENGGNQLGVVNPDDDGAFTLTATDRHAVLCASDTGANSEIDRDIAPTITAHNAKAASYVNISDHDMVRRLTPLECERLQGFPDGWTDVPYRGKMHSSDSVRYRALGNSMAVPVMRWIGERISLQMKEE